MAQEPEPQTAFPMYPIAHFRGCFPAKFGVPRQPGLIREARGRIELLEEFAVPDMVRGLEAFSHVWVVFVFHMHLDSGWSPTVRPPRLGGNRRIGVLSSRSPYRPNPIGISVLKLENITVAAGKVTLEVSGVDLVDGTPVLDVKPYIPYADAIGDADAGFAARPPGIQLSVVFSESAHRTYSRLSKRFPGLERLIRQMIAMDPRPAYQANRTAPDQVLGMNLHGLNIRWSVHDQTATVLSIEETVAD